MVMNRPFSDTAFKGNNTGLNITKGDEPSEEWSKDLFLTREDIVPILEKHYKDGVLDFMGFTKDILEYARLLIRKDERERIVKELELHLHETSKWGVHTFRLNDNHWQSLKQKVKEGQK